MKTKFNGNFYIPDSVKRELVDRPIMTKKFKLEAIMIDRLILDGQLLVHKPLEVDGLLQHVNKIYSVNGQPITILQKAEIEALLLVLRLQADAYVVDERTMRMIIENPKLLRNLLEKKLHRRVEMDNKLAKEFLQIVKGVNVIRSSEVMVIAYELGLLNKYLTVNHKAEDLLDGLLWGLKLRGCGISGDEISEIVRSESKLNVPL